MKNLITGIVLSTMLVSLCAVAMVSFAPAAKAIQDTTLITNDMDTVGSRAFGEAHDDNALPKRIGNIIKIVLGVLGVILVIIVVYAGFLWMTAGGETEQVKKAKDWMTNAVIGLIIILSAYAITDFVISKLITATQQ